MRTRFFPLLALLLVACNADPGVPMTDGLDAGTEDLGALGDTPQPGPDTDDVGPQPDGVDAPDGGDVDLPDLPDDVDAAEDVETSPVEDVVVEDADTGSDTADDVEVAADATADPVDEVGEDVTPDVETDADVAQEVSQDVVTDTPPDVVDPDTGEPPGPVAAVHRFWSAAGAVQAATGRHRAVLSFGTPASGPVSTTARHRIVWGAGGLLR